MMAKLGDLAALQQLRDSLIRDKLSEERDRQRLEGERWEAFRRTAHGIVEAIEGQSLSDLVSNVRRMKNLLRRPSVKRDLARMEGSDSEGKDKPKGSCKCAQCGETIDGYNDCIKGALCVKCAMKDRDAPPGEKEREKDKKTAEKGAPFPPEMITPPMPTGAPEEEPVTQAPEGEPEEEPEEEEPETEPSKVSNAMIAKTIGVSKKAVDSVRDEENPEEPKVRSKLRKKGFKGPQKESDEVSVCLRRKGGLRRRNYEKWNL